MKARGFDLTRSYSESVACRWSTHVVSAHSQIHSLRGSPSRSAAWLIGLSCSFAERYSDWLRAARSLLMSPLMAASSGTWYRSGERDRARVNKEMLGVE